MPVHFIQDNTGRAEDLYPGSIVGLYCLLLVAVNPIILSLWLFFAVRAWSISAIKKVSIWFTLCWVSKW